MASKGNEVRSTKSALIIGWIIGLVTRFLGHSIELEIRDLSGITDPETAQGPVIYSNWHNRVFLMPYFWNIAVGGHRDCYVLTSASKDGAMLAKAIETFGIRSVRGSSSRRGAAALVALRKHLRAGYDIAITPDGPKGPIYQVQPGIIKLAQVTKAPIQPIHMTFESAWTLKTWDGFRIPKPYSKVIITFGECLHIPSELDEAGLSQYSDLLQKTMREHVEPETIPLDTIL